MRIFYKLLVLASLALVVSSLNLMTKEEYEIMKHNADFEVMDYITYLEIFADKQKYKKPVTSEEMNQEKERLMKEFEELDAECDSEYKTDTESFLGTDYLPTEFSWKVQKPNCFVYGIKDQGSCGACFAFSSTFALAKRFCALDNIYHNVDLSPQDLVSCDDTNYKCDGGSAQLAFRHFTSRGVATESCVPYQSYVDRLGKEHVPTCNNDYCTVSYISYKRYKCKPNSTVVLKDPKQIMLNIYKYGPMATNMKVYGSFHLYIGGIYHTLNTDSERNLEGYHAVAIIGWGYDAIWGYYWIVANSWGERWGENGGYFRIPFGNSEIGKMYAAGCTPLFE